MTHRQSARCSTISTTEPPFGRKLWGLLSPGALAAGVSRPRRPDVQAVRERRQRQSRHDDATDFMKVLITGGAGFIGSHLADRLLARGDEVAGHRQLRDRPARQPARRTRTSTLVEGTIADAELVEQAFARRPAGGRRPCRGVLQGSRRLGRGRAHATCSAPPTSSRRHAAAKVTRLIYFQTALCYGLHPLEQPITLDHPLRPEGTQLRDQQDRRRAVRRSCRGSTGSRSGSPTPTARATSAARCRRSIQRLTHGQAVLRDGHAPRLHLRRRPGRRA